MSRVHLNVDERRQAESLYRRLPRRFFFPEPASATSLPPKCRRPSPDQTDLPLYTPAHDRGFTGAMKGKWAKILTWKSNSY